MKYIIPIGILVAIGLCVIFGGSLFRAVFPPPPTKYQAQHVDKSEEKLTKQQIKQESSSDVKIVMVDPGPFLRSDIVVTADGEVFKVGQMSQYGYVDSVENGQAKVVSGSIVTYVVPKGGDARVIMASFQGVLNDAVLIEGGQVFRVGEECIYGVVKSLTRYRVHISRFDGGNLFICDTPPQTQPVLPVPQRGEEIEPNAQKYDNRNVASHN